VVLLYFGEWGMIIPIVVVGIVILLMSGAGEGIKTALATVILLMYIFGALGYFLFTSFFVTAAKESVIETGVSPSGDYRYRVVNTEDSSNGSTAVYVEPNTADVKYAFATFTLKNLEHVVFLDRPMDDEVHISWKTENRQEITDHLNHISDKIEVTLTDAELEKLGFTYDNKLMLTNLSASRKFAINRTASDVDPVALDDLTEDQLDFFGIGREPGGRYYIKEPSAELLAKLDNTTGSRVYFNEMPAKVLKYYNNHNIDLATGITYFNVAKNHTVMLNTLTDAQLADLGVSESGDVMLLSTTRFAGEDGSEEIKSEEKVVFRFYVAELEDYYNVDSRSLSVDLLN
jgi:hypothetical protein